MSEKIQLFMQYDLMQDSYRLAVRIQRNGKAEVKEISLDVNQPSIGEFYNFIQSVSGYVFTKEPGWPKNRAIKDGDP